MSDDTTTKDDQDRLLAEFLAEIDQSASPKAVIANPNPNVSEKTL